MTWHVYCDGSALTIDGCKPPYVGGWAAIVEHGSEGFVLRGRERKTTNTKMELRAAIEGLRAAPAGALVVLHTDCSLIFTIKERQARFQLPSPRNCVRDQHLWLELGAELELRTVQLRAIPRGGHPIHRRAHKIAKAEARALERGLPETAEVIELLTRKERQRWLREEADMAERERQRQYKRDRHARDCLPGRCATSCALWQRHGSAVYVIPSLKAAERPATAVEVQLLHDRFQERRV